MWPGLCTIARGSTLDWVSGLTSSSISVSPYQVFCVFLSMFLRLRNVTAVGTRDMWGASTVSLQPQITLSSREGGTVTSNPKKMATSRSFTEVLQNDHGSWCFWWNASPGRHIRNITFFLFGSSPCLQLVCNHDILMAQWSAWNASHFFVQNVRKEWNLLCTKCFCTDANHQTALVSYKICVWTRSCVDLLRWSQISRYGGLRPVTIRTEKMHFFQSDEAQLLWISFTWNFWTSTLVIVVTVTVVCRFAFGN